MISAPSASLPLVSIVLAVYNGEKYLPQQLDSLLSQDYPNFEIIASDDCSSDQSLKILREYALSHPQLQVYANSHNLGLNKNFEKALLLAQGAYLAISDQDDVWKKEKISTLVREIDPYTMIYHDSQLIDSHNSLIDKKLSDINRLIPHHDCLNYTIATRVPGHAMLFRRSLLKDCIPFPQDHIVYDHWLAFIATFSRGIKFINSPLVYYRQHENNTYGADFIKINNRNTKSKISSKKKPSANERLRLLYDKCPASLALEKKVLGNLLKSYNRFSVENNFRRMFLFFKYNTRFLAHKKYGQLRRWLFCFKTFLKRP